MATDASRHTIPADGESFGAVEAFEELSRSIRDVRVAADLANAETLRAAMEADGVDTTGTAWWISSEASLVVYSGGRFLPVAGVSPVVSVAARNALAATVAPSSSRPLITIRADATPGQEVEYTLDGSTWRVLADLAAGWSPIPPASGYSSTGYSRLEQGGTIVRLAGRITKDSGSLPRATTFGTLTAAYRPSTERRIAAGIGNAVNGNAASGMLVSSTGEIQVTADSSALSGHTILYLDGITFPLADAS